MILLGDYTLPSLDVHFRSDSQRFLVLVQNGLDDILQELLGLLGRTSNVVGGVHYCLQFLQVCSKGWICRDTFQQVVVQAFFLDPPSRCHRVDTDLLMELLTIPASLYSIHHDILGGHEGKLRHEAFLDNLRIYYKSVNYINAQIKYSVCCKESLGH